MQHETHFDDLIIYIFNKMHIYLLIPVSSRLHGLSGSVLVPTASLPRQKGKNEIGIDLTALFASHFE